MPDRCHNTAEFYTCFNHVCCKGVKVCINCLPEEAPNTPLTNGSFACSVECADEIERTTDGKVTRKKDIYEVKYPERYGPQTKEGYGEVG